MSDSRGDPPAPGGGELEHPDLAVGERLDRYRVLRLLGRGGMGQVYEVEHIELRTRHALKIIPSSLAGRSGFVERFRREARVMARLRHPGIVHVDDFAITERRYWLRMDLVRGVRLPSVGDERAVTLGDLAAVENGRVPEALLAGVLLQVLDALAYAHEQGVVHRDLKPANILLEEAGAADVCFAATDGAGLEAAETAVPEEEEEEEAADAPPLQGLPPLRARIADFGLVRLVGEDWLHSAAARSVSLSMSLGGLDTETPSAGESTRSLLGTYAYMSPEQKRSGEADARSDIYALGLTTARLLTGLEDLGYDLPSQIVPSLHPGWDDLVRQAIAPQPERRYQSSRDMRAAVAAIAEAIAARGAEGAETPADARPDVLRAKRVEAEPEAPAPAPKPRDGGSRGRAAVTVVLVLLIALGVGGYLFWQTRETLRRQEDLRHRRAEQYRSAMSEGRSLAEGKRYPEARAAFQRALAVPGHESDADAKAMLDACRDGAEVSRRELAYRSALQALKAAFGKAKGTREMARWKEVRRLGEAAVRIGHDDTSEAQRMLVEAGRVMGVTIADMVPAQTRARMAWDRVKDLGRGQSFGKRLDEARFVRTNAEAFAARNAYAEAKYAYDDLTAKCGSLQRLDDARRSALEARRKAEAARRLALESGARRLPEGAEGGAAAAYEAGRFEQARKGWEQAVEQCNQARAEALARREAYAAKAAYEQECRTRETSRLSAHGGAAWREVARTVAEAEAALKAGDCAKATKAWSRARALLPGAVRTAEAAHRAGLRAKYDAAMGEGRKRLAARDYAKAEAAYQSALRVEGYSADATAKRLLEQTRRGLEADRKRRRYEASLAAARQWRKTAKAGNDIEKWRKVASLAEYAIKSGHGDVSEAQRLLGEANAKLGAAPWPSSTKFVRVAIPAGTRYQRIAYYTNSIAMKLVRIPAGEFKMGTPSSEKGHATDEAPVHRVRITRPFFMGAYEVTQEQYQRVMGANPSGFKGSNRPVENVRWSQADDFCKRLTRREGVTYRLPTEAEWEYACRAGSTTPFYWGTAWVPSNGMAENAGSGKSNTAGSAHYKSKRLPVGGTAPVGSFLPNGFGLYDMGGNVWEWCQDRWSNSYYKTSPSTDPQGPTTGTNRVERGGGWKHSSAYCRSGNRNWGSSTADEDYLGFRVVALPKAGAKVTVKPASPIRKSLNVVVHAKWADTKGEAGNIISLIEKAKGKARVTRTTMISSWGLGRVLRDADVLIVPELTENKVKRSDILGFGRTARSALQSFLRRGGRVVVTAEWGDHSGFMEGARLLDYALTKRDGDCTVVKRNWLTSGLSYSIKEGNALEPIIVKDKSAEVLVKTKGGDAAVVLKPIGKGCLIYIAWDYFSPHADAKKVMENAVFGGRP